MLTIYKIESLINQDFFNNKVIEQGEESVSLNTLEYLRQIGKRIQVYWGTSYPKHFIRTFSEISQLLKGADGLSIRIVDEDNLQKVRLEIEPYQEKEFKELKKNNTTNTFFNITSGVLSETIAHFSSKHNPKDTTISNHAIGLDFCIGKETSEAENYNYSIIIQAVNICHNRIVDESHLPLMIPEINTIQP